MKKILLKISIFLLLVFSISIYAFISYFPAGSVILEPVGGLGNQLFQYAAAYSLAKKTDSKLIILIDNYQGGNEYTRRLVPNNDYALGDFSISEEAIMHKNFITKAYINMALQISPDDGLSFVYNKKVGAIAKLAEKLFNVEVASKENFFDLGKKINKKRILMRDYFTSDIYFKDIKNDIFKQFTLSKINSNKVQSIIDQVSSKNSVCMHLRRGDMVKAGFFIPGYEKRAVNLIKELIDVPRFFIFSDDIDGVRQEILEYQIPDPSFVSDYSTLEDFLIMSKCSNIITALSTFSWWAAYLSQNDLVLAPDDFKKFFPRGAPKNWHLINYHEEQLYKLHINIIF